MKPISPSPLPKFGVTFMTDFSDIFRSRSLYHNPAMPEQSNGLDFFLRLPQPTMDAMQELCEHREPFLNSLGDIEDSMDPITVTMGFQKDGLSATISSNANGSEVYQKPEDVSLKTFLDNIAVWTRGFAASLKPMSEQEGCTVDEASRFATRALNALQNPESLHTVKPLNKDGLWQMTLSDGENEWWLLRYNTVDDKPPRLQVSSGKDTLTIGVDADGNVECVRFNQGHNFTDPWKGNPVPWVLYEPKTGNLESPITQAKNREWNETSRDLGIGSWKDIQTILNSNPLMEENLQELSGVARNLYPLLAGMLSGESSS